MRVAVTGATGRLGRALLELARRQQWSTVIGWERRDFDLDAPQGVRSRLDRDRPDVVIHCAAWTDVDGCAREPGLAELRNGLATGVLAAACAERGVGLLAVSTNEVFDGRRTDEGAYRTTDPTSPANPYGHSKLAGETAAREAYASSDAPLWVVRTAWLFGAPGRDFPTKIAEAAGRARATGEPLRLVADEVGNPTLAADLASAILDLIGDPRSTGLHHVVNDGRASRAAWARRVLAELRIDVPTEDVPLSTWQRASQPPQWGVLEPTLLPSLGRLRSWEAALSADLQHRGLAAVAAGLPG